MNLTDPKYKNFALVREMLETPGIMREFQYGQAREAGEVIRETGKLFLTGEGSSRIFPAKNMIAEILKLGTPVSVNTDGSRQSMEYDLSGHVVFGASNSGQTKEVIALFDKLGRQGHKNLLGLTANAGTKIEEMSRKTWVLSCGKEDAVAATKSVVEQGLFYQSLLCEFTDREFPHDKHQAPAADAAMQILEADLDLELIRRIAEAPVIYFAGRNNGVAEELTLKTNEITRKKSAFLEGTYAVHGIEEVMDSQEVVIVVDPYPAEAEKFQQVLVDGVGLSVVAISAEETIFPTIRIPPVWGYDTFLQLLAGWNILVHVGVALNIDLDKPVRARKVGNLYTG